MLCDLVIRGGEVITPAGTIYADIAIDGEQIVEIGPELPGGRNEINAFRKTVLPGVIDVHLHFNEPGRTDWEGGETGSHALAAGGGAVFFDMPLNSSPCTVNAAAFDAKRAALEASSITDFGLWGGLIPGNIGDMAELAERGVVGFKAFMCDSGLPEFPYAADQTLYEGMREAARLGLPVAVHAESEEITRDLTEQMKNAGRFDVEAFLESRPIEAEVEAITRAGRMARETGCKLHVVHISSAQGVEAALEAREQGADISLETCPHYLLFWDRDMERLAGLAKCTPPLRAGSEKEKLYSAMFFGKIDIVASDHSPCPPLMKLRESFFDIWGGISGVQWIISALAELRLYPHQIAETTAQNPARRFGLAGRGGIAVGASADLAILDFHAKFTVQEKNALHRHRMSPYTGEQLQGIVQATIRRGEVIYSGGTITARTRGKFIRPERTTNA